MRVIQLQEYGSPSVLHEADWPLPQPENDTVRIKVKAIGVNPADLKWRTGLFAQQVPLKFPHVLGYDVAGVVDAAGPDATEFAKGDRVVAMLDPITKGGYGEFVTCPANNLAALPRGLDYVKAAALPTAALTGIQMIDEQLQARPGQTILITGATGAVGRFAMFAARRRRLKVVAAVRAHQQAEAFALGASSTITLGEDQWDGSFDHVADTVGGDAVAALCRKLAPAGRIRTVATTPINPTDLPSHPVFFSVHPDGRTLGQLVSTVAHGEIDMPVAKCLPLGQASEAHRLLEQGGLGGKLILIP